MLLQIMGYQKKVQSDLGGENVEVWRYMIHQHSSDRAIVVGSSTHNERIECLWRDVFRCVGTIFYSTFKQLEEKLDSLYEIDLYCLHRVFLPCINAALDAFVESWNHPISGERNFSPNQLFIHGALQQNITIDSPYDPSDTTTIPDSTSDIQTLSSAGTATKAGQPTCTNNCGRDVYYLVINIVGHHLSNECNNCG